MGKKTQQNETNPADGPLAQAFISVMEKGVEFCFFFFFIHTFSLISFSFLPVDVLCHLYLLKIYKEIT